jgi:hypothetical protein
MERAVSSTLRETRAIRTDSIAEAIIAYSATTHRIQEGDDLGAGRLCTIAVVFAS